ncbi:MAG: hypothetical protein P4M08_13780 [Oligoflexia bacterium]|nr:hypothetical protein [Oligoflexia bacterium]
MTQTKSSIFLLTALSAAFGCMELAGGFAYADDSALQAIQSEQAQGLTRFYQNMLANPGTSASQRHANLNAELSDSNTKFSQLATQRQEQNDSLIFNQVFLPDGSRMNASQYDPNAPVETYLKRSPARAGGTSSLSQNDGGPSFPMAFGGSGSDSSHANVRPDYVLDGSKVPKEIDFAPSNVKRK